MAEMGAILYVNRTAGCAEEGVVMGCWGHLPMKIYCFAMLAVGAAFELAGATIPASPNAAEGVVDDNLCSLHEAIAEANFPGSHSGGTGLRDECMPGSAGADVITLTMGGLYNLTQIDNTFHGANGLPRIESVISINGRGATIRRDPSYATCDGTYPDFRFFQVRGTGAYLTLDWLTLTNGCADAGNYGGAVFVNQGARLTVNASTITANRAHASGGGIGVWDGDEITIRASTITDNTAQGLGGGISVLQGHLVVNSSTISGNRAENGGGGISLSGGDGPVPINRITLNNSTVSGNSVGPYNSRGGGILSKSQGATFTELTLNNSTVTKNRATSGGGIYNMNDGPGAWVYARNSIVAEQGDGQDCYNDFGTYFSYDHNIESGISCGFTAEGDQQNVAAVGLRPLGAYGGPTETCALTLGGPAIDAGDPDGCYGDADGDGTLDLLAMDRDQRGSGYWRPSDGDGVGIARCDVGAVEFQMLFSDGFESGDTSRWSSTVP